VVNLAQTFHSGDVLKWWTTNISKSGRSRKRAYPEVCK